MRRLAGRRLADVDRGHPNAARGVRSPAPALPAADERLPSGVLLLLRFCLVREQGHRAAVIDARGTPLNRS